MQPPQPSERSITFAVYLGAISQLVRAVLWPLATIIVAAKVDAIPFP